jgi:hypothetical protein
MQGEDGKLVSTKPGYQIAIAHSTEQTLRDDRKNLISDPVPIDVVDLLKAVQVEKDESVHGTFSGWSGARSLERVIKLPPIGEPRQSILEGKRADMLFCREAANGFAPLLDIPPYGKDQQTQRHNSAEKQRFI